VTAGRDRIGRVVNLASLDMAVVAFEPDNGHGAPPPAIDRTVASTVDAALTKILVTGYPAKPGESQAPDEDDPATFLAFWDRIGELYGEDYGVKYMSPGLIMARPGAVAGDAKGWAFTHDATTLPGNSGSAIISLHGAMEFCGLHFGGSTLTMNLAHDIDRVFEGGDGVFSTAFLNGPGG
jgi:serine protease